jgi:hypothetical protein
MKSIGDVLQHGGGDASNSFLRLLHDFMHPKHFTQLFTAAAGDSKDGE